MITSFDTMILNLIQEFVRNDFLDLFFVFVTKLGDEGYIWIAMAILLLFRKDTRKYGLMVGLALLLGLLINNNGIKPLVARSRPCWVNEIELLISMPSGYSFPSGHTCSSMAAAYVLNKWNPKYGKYIYALAILIAFSRLYLYVHYPTDVLVGALVGTLCGAISLWLYKKGYLSKLFSLFECE